MTAWVPGATEALKVGEGQGEPRREHGETDEGLEAVIESGAAICPTFTFLANLAYNFDRLIFHERRRVAG